MRSEEGPKEAHERMMRIVNKRRALGEKVPDLDVNRRLLQALQSWDANIVSNIRDKDGFRYFTTDEVIGKVVSQKQQIDQGNRINALLKDKEKASGSKNDLALNAEQEKKKNVVEESDDDSDDEMALFVKRFNKLMSKRSSKKNDQDEQIEEGQEQVLYLWRQRSIHGGVSGEQQEQAKQEGGQEIQEA